MFALGPYEGLLLRTIRLLKFHGRSALARPLGRLLATAVDQAKGEESRVWVPVPSHPARTRLRGYDHVQLLARFASQAAGHAVDHRLLRRVTDTPPLYQLGRLEREAVLRSAFTAVGRSPPLVFLVDDLLTTGATARHAARCLRAAGAEAVDLVVVARA